MPDLSVEALYVYPYKGCRPVPVDVAATTPRGFAGDRRFMVTDAEGLFLTQRAHPALGHPTVSIDGTGFTASHAELGTIVVRPPRGDATTSVRVWGDSVSARACSAEADEFFSRLLGQTARLVYMPESADRVVGDEDSSPLSFADGAPYLITTTASLGALNDRIDGEPVPMTAFRPSIVLAGARPWDEDRWETLALADTTLTIMSDCERCKVTTLDPEHPGRPRRDGEPLRTLAKFRRNARGNVTFGRYGVLRDGDAIRVGDPVTAR